MKKRIAFVSVLVIGLCLYFYPSKKYDYELAICAIFKDEAPWLKEWVTYHHEILGVEHFYLYNNDSSDNYEEVLSPFMKKGIVELFSWSSNDPSHQNLEKVDPSDAPFYKFQIGAYNDCLRKKALGKAKWVAIIDIDEFIFAKEGKKAFYHLLKKCERKNKNSLKLSWRIFGTSDIKELTPDELLTEKMVYRAKDSYYWHNWFKCIHRPEAISFCHIHDAIPKNTQDVPRHADPKKFCINHYWTRSENFCEKKRKQTKKTHPEFFQDLKEVKDESLKPFIPKLKKALNKL